MRWFFASILVALCAMSPRDATAAELIMVRQIGCYWCILWDEEIGIAYPKSEEGHFAPLRQIDIRGPLPSYITKPVTITPTFLLVENDKEVGRMIGYPGKNFFWELLAEMLQKSTFTRKETP
ncbi:thioredoxin [Hyphomicrobium methylovorum]|uniref:thioredoxin n=1 Tax=Hyphomicrobium methylovorum TaxID=84 RepID=UPI0015E76B36|nr:thioredoxin [Hyphomicrobium methylovorum]MBA2126967.1 thioredoxin [Hyphomicrobium methylovorum]